MMGLLIVALACRHTRPRCEALVHAEKWALWARGPGTAPSTSSRSRVRPSRWSHASEDVTTYTHRVMAQRSLSRSHSTIGRGPGRRSLARADSAVRERRGAHRRHRGSAWAEGEVARSRRVVVFSSWA